MKRNKQGFTLIETLTTILIFTMLMAGISALFKTIFSDSAQERLALDNADQARILTTNFVNEIRSAAYGVDGSYPITLASTTQITFYTTFGASTSTAPLKIRYFASSTALYKGITTPAGSPLSYASSTEKTYLVQSALVNGSTPVFYYFDGNYAGTSTPLTQPVNINSIKFVKINLIVTKQDTRTGTSTFGINNGGTIRNLKTNLGN